MDKNDIDRAEAQLNKTGKNLLGLWEVKLTPKDKETRAFIHALRVKGVLKLGDTIPGLFTGASGPPVKVEGKIEGRDASSRPAVATQDTVTQALADGEVLFVKRGKKYHRVAPEALSERIFQHLAENPIEISAWTSWDTRGILALPR